MRRILALLLLTLITPRPADAAGKLGFRAREAERIRKQLKSIGMATNSKFVWNSKEGVSGSTDGKVVRLNRNARNRSALLNTIAHEMKHVRDSKFETLYKKQSAQLLAEAKSVLKQTDPLIKRHDTSRKVEALFARHDAIIKQFDVMHAAHSDWVETRANRAGAFAMGRLGRSLGESHLISENDPTYAKRENLIWANINGYTLGAKVSLRRSPEFETLSKPKQQSARLRMHAYLGAYAEMLGAQAQENLKRKPDFNAFAAAQPLSVRVAARRAQNTETLKTKKQLIEAGQRDAWLGLSPLARKAELLK